MRLVGVTGDRGKTCEAEIAMARRERSEALKAKDSVEDLRPIAKRVHAPTAKLPLAQAHMSCKFRQGCPATRERGDDSFDRHVGYVP
jgi:hypothetical protein